MKKLAIGFMVVTDDDSEHNGIGKTIDILEFYEKGELTRDKLKQVFKYGELPIFRYLADEMGLIAEERQYYDAKKPGERQHYKGHKKK